MGVAGVSCGGGKFSQTPGLPERVGVAEAVAEGEAVGDAVAPGVSERIGVTVNPIGTAGEPNRSHAPAAMVSEKINSSTVIRRIEAMRRISLMRRLSSPGERVIALIIAADCKYPGNHSARSGPVPGANDPGRYLFFD